MTLILKPNKSEVEMETQEEVNRRGKGKTHTPEILAYKKEIGNRIKEIRQRVFGENQTKVAKRLEIPQSHFSNIENGNTFPTIPLLTKIINISGVNWSWLMTGKGPMTDEEQTGEKGKTLATQVKEYEEELRNLQETKRKQDKIIENQNVLIDMLKQKNRPSNAGETETPEEVDDGSENQEVEQEDNAV